MFLASHLTSHWSGSVLAGGHWQSRNDRDDDGWADLAGYGRGVFPHAEAAADQTIAIPIYSELTQWAEMC